MALRTPTTRSCCPGNAVPSGEARRDRGRVPGRSARRRRVPRRNACNRPARGVRRRGAWTGCGRLARRPRPRSVRRELDGHRGRRLEIDAFSFDDADDSLHLFIAIHDGGQAMPPRITLSEAREQGFNRLLGRVRAGSGGVADTKHRRESASVGSRPPVGDHREALSRAPSRRHRSHGERAPAGDPAPGRPRRDVPVTFQIWDVTRLQRIHEARNARDDLFVDLTSLPGGGLAVLPAAVGVGDYDAYLAVIPGDFLAGHLPPPRQSPAGGQCPDVSRSPRQRQQGDRLHAREGAGSLLRLQQRDRNDGVGRDQDRGPGHTHLLTGVSDLQIVNGAQTTASLAALRREGKLPLSSVFVPMKLSVVAPEVAGGLVQEISRCANSQNAVRQSDFFANHPFHLQHGGDLEAHPGPGDRRLAGADSLVLRAGAGPASQRPGEPEHGREAGAVPAAEPAPPSDHQDRLGESRELLST